MKPVRLYVTKLCPYCASALRLLTQKNVTYEAIDVTYQPEERAKMRALAGGKNSVPQIWIGDTHVGGCDDLYALEDAGKLDALLGQ